MSKIEDKFCAIQRLQVKLLRPFVEYWLGVADHCQTSPDVTDITVIAQSVVEAGADALALINTLLGMVIDTNTMAPKLSQKTGGLSGPAIRQLPYALLSSARPRFQILPSLEWVGSQVEEMLSNWYLRELTQFLLAQQL